MTTARQRDIRVTLHGMRQPHIEDALAQAYRDGEFPPQETPMHRAMREGTLDAGKTDIRFTPGAPGIVLPDGYEVDFVGQAEWPVDDPQPDTLEAAAERGVRALLDLVADDADRSGLEDTPARVVRAYQEMTSGYDTDIEALLSRQFDEIDTDGMVVLRQIDFVSLCEHHLLPFPGVATVAYIPDEGGSVVGLSKLARLVDAYAHRLQVQERLTTQITAALDEYVQGKGSACVIRASHSCMTIRGVKKHRAEMVTSSLTGAFKDDGRARAEFMALAGQ